MPASRLRLLRFSAYSRWFGWVLPFFICAPLAPAQIKKGAKAAYLNHGTISAGNGVYQVAIEDFLQEGVGLYTISTDTRHPITSQLGSKQDLLAGGSKNRGLPGTSYTTIRSYSSRTDYVQSRFAANDSLSQFTAVWLDTLLCNDDDCLFDPSQYITRIFDRDVPTGFAITYNLPPFPKSVTRDRMRIIKKVNVRGSTFDDSWVEVTTSVANTGQNTLEIGMRYLWDLNIGNDDGPEVFEKLFNTSLGNNEKRLDWLNFSFARVARNDAIGVNPPRYNVFASVITPTNFLRAPFLPSRLQVVSWPLAFFHAFDYGVEESRTISTPADPNAGLTGGDNALQYFWGPDRDSALTIAPGDSVQVTQVLLASFDDAPPMYDFQPPFCDLAAVNPGPPKSFEFVVQDATSGLRMLRAQNVFNANVEIPDFETGTTDLLKIVGTVLDQSQPFGFTVLALDLSGNEILCDPVFLTLQPGLSANVQRFPLIASDRYFYIKNQGIRRLVANLNGHEFILTAAGASGRNTFAMPLLGEMTIDMQRYLQKDDNTMTIAFEGPPGSRADLIISDMKMKSEVDFVLNLAEMPRQFALQQNSPNPFNSLQSATAIRFDVPEAASHPGGTVRVQLRIYNILGQVVRTLVDGNLPAGLHQINWHGRDETGRRVQAGVYFYELISNNTRITKKLALLR